MSKLPKPPTASELAKLMQPAPDPTGLDDAFVATVASDYSSGDLKLLFPGETTAGTRTFKVASGAVTSYRPGDKVLVQQVGKGNYAVLGKLVSPGGDTGGALVGEIKAYAGGSVPSGYLACDGSAQSRTTYAALFAAIGTTYGAGDGSTTFNLPDLRGKFAMGASGSHARGSSGGSETVTLTQDNMPNRVLSDSGSPVDYSLTSGGTRQINASRTPTAVSILNPFLAIQYIIKT